MKLVAFLILMSAVSSVTFAGTNSHVTPMPSGSVVGFTEGQATITNVVAGEHIVITVKTSKVSEGYFKEGFRWGGEDSSAPGSLVSSVTVRSGAERLFVPVSAYADLGDPRKLSLKFNATGFDVFISGGDAGVAYTAVLVFKDGWLIRRRVAHGEFPAQAWEETKYAYNILDN